MKAKGLLIVTVEALLMCLSINNRCLEEEDDDDDVEEDGKPKELADKAAASWWNCEKSTLKLSR